MPSKNYLCKILIFSIIFKLISCDQPLKPIENQNEIINFVRLQNQSEHSGILIKIKNTDAFAITDSNGFFNLPEIENGEYTIQVKYPFFKIIEKKITIKDGVIKDEISYELKQQIQFWVEPAEMTITLSEQTRFWNFRGYVKNISDTIVTSTYGIVSMHWGLIPENLSWNLGINDVDTNKCDAENWNIGLTDLIGLGGYSLPVGFSGYESYKDIALLGYDCTPPGVDYLFFYSLVDEANFPEYYEKYLIVEGEYIRNPNYNILHSSFRKKRELFKPAKIKFID